MRRLMLILAAAAAALAIGGVKASDAQAALTCPSYSVSQPSWDTNRNLAVTWTARCNGGQWSVELYLQYESGGVWHLENCAGTQPCQINRPSGLLDFYAGGTSQGGTVHFDPLNGCDVRFRAFMVIDRPNGDVFGPFTGPPNHVC